MNKERTAESINRGRTALGIELGSTRIKSVLIDDSFSVIATGSFQWENSLIDGLWTYNLEDAVKGIRASFKDLSANVLSLYGTKLTTVGSLGISGMMHGIVALDTDDKQITPFLTWRNTNTSQASAELTELFQFNVPLRWTISQLYQAMIEKKPYVKNVSYVCTLAGYIHYLLSSEKVIGIDEASGMFPIDSDVNDFNSAFVAKFDSIVKANGYSWNLKSVFPKVLVAGQSAGCLTEKGALLLDPTGTLKAGVPMVPPEGDAGTGMVATDSVSVRTGNVSAGTSIFSMIVLEKQLSRLYRDIDMVTTPTGKPVAMVHCNNGTSEFDQWFAMFRQMFESVGVKVSSEDMYRAFFNASQEGDADCSDVIFFNYLSGEPVTGLINGRPLLTRKPESDFSFANFMRSQLYSVFAALAIGHEIFKKENVKIDRLTAHGGMFKTEGVAQRYLAAALDTSVNVLSTAGEGGPYGMALLAAYPIFAKDGYSFDDFLDKQVFASMSANSVTATKEEVEGYAKYLASYKKLLNTQKSAVENS